MMEKYFLATCLFGCILVVSAGPGSFITKCRSSDSNCIKESTQKAVPIFANGIPELGVEVLDPMSFKKLDASSHNLKLEMTDVTITGLKDCQVKKSQMDASKLSLSLKLSCDGVLNGNYEMSGKLLVLPIEGKGKVHAHLRKLVISADCAMEEKTGKDGKKHWRIKNYSHSYELKDKADVDFENLFNGNELLGRAARELITNNGNDIVLEVGPPVVKAMLEKVVANIQNLFKHLPVEELSLD